MANTYVPYGANDTGGAFLPPQSVIAAPVSYDTIAFKDGYTGMTWMKAIFTMWFPYFNKAESTPFSGQLYPTGSAFTTSGQGSPVG